MKHLTIYICVLAFAACLCQAKAQEIIATSGGYYEGQSLSMSWTVGEAVIETFNSGELILTQGFQQPYNFHLQQILNIPMGWSGVSTYLDPLNKGMDGIFAPYQNELIIMASMDGIYFPGQGINTLGNWDFQSGYQIKAEDDFEMSITGAKIQNPELALAEGWNLIPVLSSCDLEVENLFSGISSLQIVKEVAGTNLYWPAYNINTLGNLVPGKAYFVAAADAGTIVFPECAKSSPKTNTVSRPVNPTPWNDLHYTATSHAIAFPVAAFQNSGILPGDVIGIFSFDGLCCGQAEITNLKSNMAITAFANDEITMDKDGFENGEPFRFKAYRPASDQQFDLEASFDPALPNMGFFAAHGLSALQSLKLQETGIAENPSITFEVYPNPSHGFFNISLSSYPQNLQIQITDIRGSIIKVLEFGGSDFQIDLSGNPKGVYFLKLYDDGFVGMKKVVVN